MSRRAVLKGALGTGVVALVPGLACGYDDAEVFADATARPTSTTTESTTTTTTESTTTTTTESTTTNAAESTTTTTTESTSADVGVAVAGDLVIDFTYTQGAGGKNERPYIAVWIEDEAGELISTVALWYEQGRRGDRWLDHLTRWYDGNLAASSSNADTVSSATRAAGAYSVVWDGLADFVPAPPGNYFVCIESAREDGPYSLIRDGLTLAGDLTPTALPDDGELSAATVRIDA